MNATQPSFTPPHAASVSQPANRSDGRRPRLKLHRRPIETPKVVALETAVKLMINLGLAIAAFSALATLVPDYQARRAKLNQMQAAIRIAERQTSHLRGEFSRYFDPRQANSVMREQSGGGAPLKPQIVWIEPPTEEP